MNMIRVMQISDVSRVAEIHVFGWRSAYRGIVSDEFLFNKMIVSNRIKWFENAVRNQTEESYVFDDGIIKAILTIGACRDSDKTKSFELWGIYVEPFMKRQGIGSKMVNYCEKTAIERGYNEVCLWVLKNNTDARLFYENLGYYPDGAEKFIDFLAASEIRYSKEL
jgi:ribosomal protein S18 acetylase RimI-like enzyme